MANDLCKNDLSSMYRFYIHRYWLCKYEYSAVFLLGFCLHLSIILAFLLKSHLPNRHWRLSSVPSIRASMLSLFSLVVSLSLHVCFFFFPSPPLAPGCFIFHICHEVVVVSVTSLAHRRVNSHSIGEWWSCVSLHRISSRGRQLTITP